VVDLNGNALEANQAYANMSGFSIDKLINMHITRLDAINYAGIYPNQTEVVSEVVSWFAYNKSGIIKRY
jgi:PAS domain S-box-containing protein